MDYQGILKYFGEFLSAARYLYWFLAIFGTLVFSIQLILTFLGVGTDGSDADVDADGQVEFGEHADSGFSEMRLFSTRALFAFITFFGWGGVLWGKSGWSGFFMALVCGFVMMLGTALLIYILLKLQHSGNVQYRDILGCKGTVYMNVPGGMKEPGKVTVNVGECTREIAAFSEEALTTGTPVVVEEHIEGNRFVVKKIVS